MKPKISVVVPCFNENKYIENCIKSVLSQTLPLEQIELLIVDGMSTDGTREIVLSFSEVYPNIKLVDNIKRITPVALNLGIKNSTGDYITVWGAHAEYRNDYLENSLKLFSEHPEISCAGGPIKSKGLGHFGEATALVMSSIIGVGNAKHRFPDYEGYAEMACFPMFKKEVFSKIGLYDEKLVKNQDDEFCFRLRLNGDYIYISPDVVSTYYTRSTPKSLFRQYYDYGLWRLAVLKKHRIPISYRQQVPAIFFITLIMLILAAFIFKNIFIGIILPILYLGIILIFTITNILNLGFRSALYIPLSVFILHLAYAAGFLHGFVKFFIRGGFE